MAAALMAASDRDYPMSTHGTKGTSASTQLMSAFGSKADIDQRCRNVCYRRSAKIAVYQCALINCTPLRPLPLNQASANAINAKPRPSPAATAKA